MALSRNVLGNEIVRNDRIVECGQTAPKRDV